MVTSSCVRPLAQGPLLTVQRNTLIPTPRSVTVVVGESGLVMVPCPLTSVHWPVAGKMGALPKSVVMFVGVHRSWSWPASAAALSASNTKMLTRSTVGAAQGPLNTVHSNTFSPTARPVMAVAGDDGSAMLPWPLTKVHWPVAGKMRPLPAITVLVCGVHSS